MGFDNYFRVADYAEIGQLVCRRSKNSPRFRPDERHVSVARVGKRFTVLIYSYRIAAIGSIRAARSAGKREAALAIAVKVSIDPTRIAGSRGEVS